MKSISHPFQNVAVSAILSSLPSFFFFSAIILIPHPFSCFILLKLSGKWAFCKQQGIACQEVLLFPPVARFSMELEPSHATP